MSEWINAEDLLPEPGETVLVALPWALSQKLHVETGAVREDGMWNVSGRNTRKVKYWMPMPAPPEEENK